MPKKKYGSMATVCVNMPKELLEAVDEMIDAGLFPNRSEVVRAAVRELAARYICRKKEEDMPPLWPGRL